MTEAPGTGDRDDAKMEHVEQSIQQARTETTETQEEGVFDEQSEARERATEGGPPEQTFIAGDGGEEPTKADEAPPP
jgi:hypothetical protein